MRHAKSSWKFPELDDHDRPLNKRGKRDAPLMADILKEKKIIPDLILSSTAVRALKYAEILADKLDYGKKNIKASRDYYFADLNEIIKIIRSVSNNYNNVFFIGHNPEITYLANFLSGKDVNNIPTSGVFGLKYDINDWSELDENNGKFNLFYYPKLFLK
ncbi:MAG TPA: histidine phosphatase family protein [Ignavibacteria bacterium]|nr:histidine phosphatase family protein [Ignavibacteria bacterium]